MGYANVLRKFEGTNRSEAPCSYKRPETCKALEVSLLRSDTVVSLVVMESNEKTVTLPYAGEYAIEFDSPGYEPLLTTRNLSENSLVSVTLQQIPVGLEEVIVDGRSLPKTTATGQIYTLSGKAKKSGNPFIALMEIEMGLDVDLYYLVDDQNRQNNSKNNDTFLLH